MPDSDDSDEEDDDDEEDEDDRLADDMDDSDDDSDDGEEIDLELIEERSDAFVTDYLTEAEQAFVASGEGQRERWLRANLAWSAKESVLKVLRTGLRRDTRSVEVVLAHEAGPAGWYPLRARTREGDDFAGWWRRFGAFLLTMASETPAEPPRALVDPPPLAQARPSHRWMESPVAGGA